MKHRGLRELLAAVGALGGIGVLAGAFAEYPEGVELLFSLVVVMISPGVALVPWFFRGRQGWTADLLCIPVSLSINIVVALISLYAGFWPPGWYVVALAVAAILGAVLGTPLGHRLVALAEPATESE